MSVFEEMFESIEHRVCLRDLYANFKKKFGGGTLIRDLMMGAAKTTYYQGRKLKMDEIKKVDHGAWKIQQKAGVSMHLVSTLSVMYL